MVGLAYPNFWTYRYRGSRRLIFPCEDGETQH